MISLFPGCYYNFELSSDTETVCDCYHLTNFGIIVDFTGRKNGCAPSPIPYFKISEGG